MPPNNVYVAPSDVNMPQNNIQVSPNNNIQVAPNNAVVAPKTVNAALSNVNVAPTNVNVPANNVQVGINLSPENKFVKDYPKFI